MPKFNIEEEIPETHNEPCDRCGTMPSRDFAGENLCNNCILDDVFSEMDNNN